MQPAQAASGQFEKGVEQVNKLQKIYSGIEQNAKNQPH